jgi:hypothetical protein
MAPHLFHAEIYSWGVISAALAFFATGKDRDDAAGRGGLTDPKSPPCGIFVRGGQESQN